MNPKRAQSCKSSTHEVLIAWTQSLIGRFYILPAVEFGKDDWKEGSHDWWTEGIVSGCRLNRRLVEHHGMLIHSEADFWGTRHDSADIHGLFDIASPRSLCCGELEWLIGDLFHLRSDTWHTV